MFLECFLNLKTSSDNKSPEWDIVIREKGCSRFVLHVMDAHSIFSGFNQKFT